MTTDTMEPAPARDTRWRRLLEHLDWKINPVLLRDLRLYTRGKLLLSGYFLTVAALVMMTILYALVAGTKGGDGRSLLGVLITLLAVVVGALVPNLVFERFRAEFANRATELALMSPLTPARLVRGKLMGAWSVSLIVISAASPMLATAYLLGGVNLLDLLCMAGAILLAALVMPTPQLLMATQRQARSMSRIVASMVFVVQLIAMFYFAWVVVEFFGEGRDYRRGFEFMTLAAIVVGGTLAAQFLYFATVSRLRSVAEYRDAAPRLSLSFAALIGGVAAVLLFDYADSRMRLGLGLFEAIAISACFVAYTFSLGFLIVSHTVPVPPPERADRRRGLVSRLFLQPGIQSLAAFFAVNAVVILLALQAMVIADYLEIWTLDEEWRIVFAGMAPLMAMAMGLNLHYYIVLPFTKDKRSPNLIPLTILLGNIVFILLGVFAIILTGFQDDQSLLHYIAAASNPAGLLYATTLSRSQLPVVGMWADVFMLVQFVLLIPVMFGAGLRRRLSGKGGDGQA